MVDLPAIIKEVRGALAIARVTGFSLAIALLAVVAIAVPDQSLEAVRVLVEDPGRRATGLAIFALAVLFLALLLWFWARALLYLLEADAIEAPGARGFAARHFPRMWGVLPILGTAWAFFRAAHLQGPEFANARALLQVSAWITLVVAAAFYAAVWGRRRLVRRQRPVDHHRPRGNLTLRQLDHTTQMPLAAAVAVWVVFFAAVFASDGGVARPFGTAAILLICLATWVPIGSLLVYFGGRHDLPILRLALLTVLAFNVFNLNDNHTVRHTSGKFEQLKPEYGQAFADWLAGRADGEAYANYPVFLVATEGGGLRAAYWTALVLGAIQDRCPAFAQHVFAISGVSGGSVGATVFDATARRNATNRAARPCDAVTPTSDQFQRVADAVLGQDLLSPLVAYTLYLDLVARLLPFPVRRFDRARALELGLERAWAKATGGHELSEPFDSLWPDFPREATPALFLNTTRVETGERTVISSLYPLGDRFNRLASFAELAPGVSLPLSTATVLSARFPFLTPEGVVPAGDSTRRYVDGGYFDNSATTTLQEMLAALYPERAVPRRRAFTPILIRIGFTTAERDTLRSRRTNFDTQGLNEVLTPVRTLLNSRGARASTAIEQLRTAVNSAQESGRDIQLLEFQLSEREVPLVLGWLLSAAARAEMLKQLPPPRQCEEIVNVQNECSYGEVVRLLTPDT